MALTGFEMSCIDDVFSELTSKNEPLSDQQQGELSIMKYGTEAERKNLIADYIANRGLNKVANEISACEAQLEFISAKKTELETKQASMQAYVP